jgi:hypothetical protein
MRHMPSGFLKLPDGRMLIRREEIYDDLFEAIIVELRKVPCAEAFADWMQSQIPGPDDLPYLGYGAWRRAVDGEIIARDIDLRGLTDENIRLFCQGAKEAAKQIQEGDRYARSLRDLAEMIERMERGEPPLLMSDSPYLIPSAPERIGPGW